jgi:hypothetical protein
MEKRFAIILDQFHAGATSKVTKAKSEGIYWESPCMLSY